jgi:serine/threonine-protein kinase
MEADSAELRQRLQTALGVAYTLDRELGGGGMARVFLAEDSKLGRRVVVKLLRPDLAVGLSARRFEREVRLAARLQHPHVVPLLSAGDVDGLPYYTMPYVEGESLRDRLTREGALGVDDVVRLLRELADALGYAHAHGVAHRDLKPENVLLSGGHAVVADFGVAKALASATQDGTGAHATMSTGVGMAVGTPAYMAPEQIAADPLVDHRADLYALGVIAYESLAGAHPFVGRPPQAMLAAHLTETPAPLATRRGDVPPALDALVTRLLAKDPAARPADAADVASALDAMSVEVAHGDRRRPWRLAGGVALALVMVAGGAAWYQLHDGTRDSVLTQGTAESARWRVLVVPFENATGDSALAPLGHMAAEAIEQGLASTGFAEVATRDAASVARGAAGLRAAANKAGAGTVVSGSYYLSGDSIRLQARVTDVTASKLLRGVDPVTAPRGAPAALLELLRQRVMALVAAAHDPHFSGWENSGPPPTYAAAEEWTTGAQFAGRGDPRRAIHHFERALTLDSSYAQAAIGASDMHLMLGEPAPADTLLRHVERRRATLMPFDAGFVDRIRGLIDGDPVAALAGARATVEAAPGAPLPRVLLATQAIAANRPREALGALSHASLQRGPVPIARRWVSYWMLTTDALHLLGEHGRELETARAARGIFPDSPEGVALELRALAALGRVDEMKSLLDRLEAMPRAPEIGARTASRDLSSIADELDVHGHADAARQVRRRVVAGMPNRPAAEQITAEGRAERARAVYLAGDYQAAAPLLARLAAERPDEPQAIAGPGLLAARRGQKAEARAVEEQLRQLEHPYDRGATPYARARLAAQLGDVDAGLAHLRDALARGEPFGPFVHSDPDLAPLRSDARYRELLRPRG